MDPLLNSFLEKPTLISLDFCDGVACAAVLEDTLYILCPKQPNVLKYNTTSLKETGRIHVKDGLDADQMVLCTTTKRLYICSSDNRDPIVHRLQLPGGEVGQWSVHGKMAYSQVSGKQMAAHGTGDIVIQSVGKFNIFSGDGELRHKVAGEYTGNLLCFIVLPGGNFVVSSRDESRDPVIGHMTVIDGKNGKKLKTVQVDSGIPALSPTLYADHLLVSNYTGSRIELVTQNLEVKKVLFSTAADGATSPFIQVLDHKTGRIFIMSSGAILGAWQLLKK